LKTLYMWRLKGNFVAEDTVDSLDSSEPHVELVTLSDCEARIKLFLEDQPSTVNTRREAIETIAKVLLANNYVIKGGFVRDTVVLSLECNDLDVQSEIDATTAEGNLFKLVLLVSKNLLITLEGKDLLKLQFQKLKELLLTTLPDLEVFSERSTGGVQYLVLMRKAKRYFTVEVQLIAAKHAWIFPISDLTCNNLSLSKEKGFELAGPSHWTLEETLTHTRKKEFGVQSGHLVPRVRMRARHRRTMGWKQVPIQETVLSTTDSDSENFSYLKNSTSNPWINFAKVIPVNLRTWDFRVNTQN
jgi:hypothetical protein